MTKGSGLRWGVAGYGDVVRRRALDAFALAGEQVAALWGRDRDRARAVARAHGVPFGTDQFEALLASADIVYLATPVAAHLPLLGDALRAGRHVLAEKPLAGALDYDRGALLASARQAGSTVGVAYYRRLAPAVGYLRAAIGGVGPLRVTARFAAPFAPEARDPMHWRTVRELSGGGVLADAGCHRLDLLCVLLGRPSMLRAEFGDRSPGGAEREARLDLGWGDGTTARMELSWNGGPAVDRLTLTTAGEPPRSWHLPVLDEGVVESEAGRDGAGRALSFPPGGNPLVPVIRDFAEAVTQRRDPACPLSDAMLVDDLIRAADRDGSWRPD